MRYDIIIVGGAPAGLTAAIYSSRRAMKTLIITQDIGGQTATTPEIENYPGFPEKIDGIKLMDNFKKQAENTGTKFVFEEVKGVTKEKDGFKVKTNTREFETKSVILSFGLTHRHLGVPGEEKFAGKGVSYCATCDAPLFKKKDVAVVGGGNSALDAALLLSKIANKVYLVHRRDEFRGEQILIDRVMEAENIEMVYNSKVKEIKGEMLVGSIMVGDINDKSKTRKIDLQGVFVEIGFQVKGDLVEGLVDLDERKQIIVNKNCETSTPGIFGAGDVTDIEYKQIVISAGEGAKAALSANKFINSGKITGVDWGSQKVNKNNK
ncbi:MAG: thioredoxin-disulfide reductase [candidate division Zixibacteria bacterium]|nr:thioredoxin-disulfide reductase [candidate division Zixibacteria bacterium]